MKTSEMAQQIRMLALSSILRAHVAERENRSCGLSSHLNVSCGIQGPTK